MSHLQNPRPPQTIQLICPKHQEYIKGVCLFNGACSERLICRSCRRTHDNNHLNNYEELDDLFNGKIANDISRDLDQLLKKVDHQYMILEKNKNYIANQINSLSNRIQQYVHEKINETKNTLLADVNHKLQENRDAKNIIIITRTAIGDAYGTLSANFQPLYEIQHLVDALFSAQSLKEQLSNNPQLSSTANFDPNASYLSPVMTENIVKQIQMSVEKVCQDIIAQSLLAPQEEQNQQGQYMGSRINPLQETTFNQSSFLDQRAGNEFIGQTSFQQQKPTISHLNVGRTEQHYQPTVRKQGPLFGGSNDIGGQPSQPFRPGSTGRSYGQQDRGDFRYGQQQFQGRNRYEPQQQYQPGMTTFPMETQDRHQGPYQTSDQYGGRDQGGMILEQEDLGGMQIEQEEQKGKEGRISKRKHTPQRLLQLFQQADEDEKSSVHPKSSLHRRNLSAQSLSSTAKGQQSGDFRRSAKTSEYRSRSKSEGHASRNIEFNQKGVLRTQHPNIPFGGLTYVPHRELLVTAGADGFIEVWNTRDKTRAKRWQAHPREIFRVLYIEKLNFVLSAGSEGNVKVWDAREWQSRAQFTRHTGPVFALEFLSDLNLIASGGEDEYLRLWKVSGGKAEQTFEMKTSGKCIGSICYIGKFRQLAVGFDKGPVNLIRFENGVWKPHYTIKAHTAYVLNLMFIEERDWLISASDDGNIIVTRLTQTKSERIYKMFQQKTMVKSIGVFLEKDLIVSNHDDKQVRFWSLSSGEKLKNYRDDTFGEGMVVLKNKNGIATGIASEVKLWTIN